MGPVIFKGKKKTSIIVRFNKKDYGLYQPIVSSKGQRNYIPLLMDEWQIASTLKKLSDLEDKEYDFGLFREIVAGACSLSMKRR